MKGTAGKRVRVSGIILLACCIVLQDCAGQSIHDLKIPDQIFPVKSASHVVYPTAQIWIEIPAGFYLQHPRPWYIQGNSNKLRITDGYVRGYNWSKEHYIQWYDDGIADKVRPAYFYRKEFKLGDRNAFIDYYKLSVNEHLEYLHMIIGNESRATVIECEFDAGDTAVRNQLVKSLLSIVVDENVVAGPGELIDYTIDTSNSSLKFSYSLGGSNYIYSYLPKDGKKEDNLTNIVTLIPFSNPLDTAAMRADAKQWVGDIKLTEKPSDISKMSGKHILINGLNAYEMTFEARMQNQRFNFSRIIAGTKRNAIALVAKIPADAKEIEQEIRRIFFTIKSRE